MATVSSWSHRDHANHQSITHFNVQPSLPCVKPFSKMAQVTWQGHHDVNGLISQPVLHPHCTQLTRSICYGSVLASYGCYNKSLQTEQLKTNICLLSHGFGGQESHTSLMELKSRCLQGCILFWRLWGSLFQPLEATHPPQFIVLSCIFKASSSRLRPHGASL